MHKSRYIFFYLAVFILCLTHWLNRSFGEILTAEQLLFHITTSVDGLSGTDNSLLYGFLYKVIFRSIFFTFMFYLAPIGFKKLRIKYADLPIFRLQLNKNIPSLLSSKCFAYTLFAAAVCFFLLKMGAGDLFKARYGEDQFSRLYVPPAVNTIKAPEKKKNLVVIYVESLEQSLKNMGEWGNVIAPIVDLPGTEVASFTSAPGTGWSIAGMIASQCAIPLKTFIKNRMASFNAKAFLPNTICIGDILAKHGYEQYFLVGPDLKFSGMDKYYLNHGYQHALGRDEWKAAGLDEGLFTGWGEGPHDDTLFDEAYKIIKKHHAVQTPYNVTIITTDSHAPNGFPSPRCSEDEKQEGIAGTFKCSSRFVAEFIQRLSREGLTKDATVIVMGDHLFMANKKQKKEFFTGERNIYFKLITNSKRSLRQQMTHFDVAPTILDDLGFMNHSEAFFGLGVSLFSQMDTGTYAKHFKAVTNTSILNHSYIYDLFWAPQTLTAGTQKGIKMGAFIRVKR